MMRNDQWIFHPVLDYILGFLLIATSGIMFFFRNDEYIILGFMAGALLFYLRGHKIGNTLLMTAFLFVLIELIQMVVFNNFSVKTTIGTLAHICFAYFVVKLLNYKFMDIYIKILYFITLVSFFFYLLLFIPGATNFIITKFTPYFQPVFKVSDIFYIYTPNIIIYNYNPDHYVFYRNCGPFWESGGFAIYLVIALIFNTYATGRLAEKKNIVFAIGILTTVSTAGYLALFFFVFGYYLLSSNVRFKVLYIILFAMIAVPLYLRLDFLNRKILASVNMAETTTTSRFGSALADLKLVTARPFIGYGRKMENRYGTTLFIRDLMHRNNGVTNLLTSYGLPMFIIYFVWYYMSFRNLDRLYKNKAAIVFLFTIIILGFSQRIFTYPFFYSFLFLRIIDAPQTAAS
jgi:hypothetical protein